VTAGNEDPTTRTTQVMNMIQTITSFITHVISGLTWVFMLIQGLSKTAGLFVHCDIDSEVGVSAWHLSFSPCIISQRCNICCLPHSTVTSYPFYL
jgi:hypothetical protein